jgi:hypothetical protein
MLRLGKILIAAALVLSIGLHWVVLQSVAWVGMAVTYTVETGSVAEGLSETLDGNHPCPLCHLVAKGKKAEDTKPEAPAPEKQDKELKLTLALTLAPEHVFIQTDSSVRWVEFSVDAKMRNTVPPVPPPRPVV